MDNLFEKPVRKEMGELNLVPIIDMFTTVIFFLLLSTVFITFNKLTVPPSRVSTITDPVAPPPLAPKMIISKSSEGLILRLNWSGRDPGQETERVSAAQKSDPANLVNAAKKLADGFHKKYPTERSLQLGLERAIEYQSLISVMDGVRDAMPDVVLISYNDAERGTKGADE